MIRFMTRSELVNFLVKKTTLDLIEMICFSMDIPYDEIPGAKLSIKVINLLKYCENHGRLDDLEQELKANDVDVSLDFLMNEAKTDADKGDKNGSLPSARTLSSEDFNRLVDIISNQPAFMNPNTRFNWVYGFLQASPRQSALMGNLNLGASAPRLDAIGLVQYLTRFGQDVPGREVITLLIDGLLQQLGEGEDTEFLRGLLER
jgi:hypothetical protein